MQLKISLKRLLLIVGIVVILSSLIIIFFLIFNPRFYNELVLNINSQFLQNLASDKSTESIQNDAFENLGLPVYLRIPKINVYTTLEYVGFTPDGAMGVPSGPTNAAWFDQGPRPGERGSSIITGHFGWKNGIPAVFDNLNKLRKGDKLYIEDEKGIITTFTVSELRTYGQNDDASEVFNSSDGKAHLNLITCGGVWDKVLKSYSNRLVVFANKE